LIKSDYNFDFDNEWLFYLALLLAVIPFWLTHFLPGVDLPGHAAQAVALQEIWRENPFFTEHFEVNLYTPYLTFTVLLALLSYLVPVGVATKLVMSAVVVATPILSGRLLGAIGGVPSWRWLIIPSTYSFAFYWGTLPFAASVPLSLVLLILTVRWDREPSAGLGVLIVGFSVLMFFCHLLVLCFSSLIALAWLAGRNYRQPLRLAALSTPYTATLPLIAIWLYQALNSGTYMTDDRVVFGSYLKRPLDIVVQFSGLDGTFFFVSLFVFVAIVALPFFSGLRFTRKPERWLAALVGLATFMLFPSYGMGTAYLYERFGVFLPLLWLILWERTPAETTRWHWIGILAVFVWSGANVLRFTTFSLETKPFEILLARMDDGKRVLTIIWDKHSSEFTTPVFLFLTSWYEAEKKGIVDYNFGMFYGTVVRYKPEKRPANVGMLAWMPETFDWQRHNGKDYDYFVVSSMTDISADIFKDRRASIELLQHEGTWWLYRPIEPQP
jgi:hypothetical protein